MPASMAAASLCQLSNKMHYYSDERCDKNYANNKHMLLTHRAPMIKKKFAQQRPFRLLTMIIMPTSYDKHVS
jgi:hypothetical protein